MILGKVDDRPRLLKIFYNKLYLYWAILIVNNEIVISLANIGRTDFFQKIMHKIQYQRDLVSGIKMA